MSGNLALVWEVFEIVWINILLSGDNAILIALACRQLPSEQRRKGMLLGALGGVGLRIGFTLVIVQLLGVPLLKTLGAVLLLGVAIKLPVNETGHSNVKAKPDLWGAVMSIIVADAVMSLDNVLAIAAAAHGSMRLIVFGLALSAPLVMFSAGYLLQAFDRFPALVWAGAGILGWVAGDMAASDPFWARFHLPLETPLSVAGAVIVLAVAGGLAMRKSR
jgi:YjbE family integral membrane protein